MIRRIATIALAVCGAVAAGTAVLAADAAVDPHALNTTAWLVSYQFVDDLCTSEPVTGTAQPMAKCLIARGEDYASYLYVCNNELGAGMLTYSGSNCEPDTFIAYTETVAATKLDQCDSSYPVEPPEVVSIVDDLADAQMFQCTDDAIGHDLLHQPAEAWYNEKCGNGLKIVGYYRATDCLNSGGSSWSVTCSKKEGFEAMYFMFDNDCPTDEDTYFSRDGADECNGVNLKMDSQYWEYTTCDGSTIPMSRDATVATAAGFGWAMISAMALLALFTTM